MFYIIYKTTNKINGKIYIGKHQTKNPNDLYLGSGKKLWESINKYGIENFEKEILFIFETEAEMNAKEAELVTVEFVKEDTNYNICPGGNGGWGYVNTNPDVRNGFEHRPDDCRDLRKRQTFIRLELLKDSDWNKSFRMKVSEGLKNYYIDNSNGFLGKTHSQQTKDIIGEKNSISQKGEKNSQHGTIWIYSLVEKTSKKIKKNQPLPDGWFLGRKLKF